MLTHRSLFLAFVIGAASMACGGGLPSMPAVPAAPSIPAAPALAGPATPTPAAAPAKPEPVAAKEAPAPAPAEEAEPSPQDKAKASPPPPSPSPVEAPGKLLTKPAKGVFQVEVASNQPSVGDEAELSRIIDKSVPLFGGGWIVIAKTEVVKVEGKKVTLKMVEEQAQMKINGKKLDHFTPGVATRLRWTPKPKN